MRNGKLGWDERRTLVRAQEVCGMWATCAEEGMRGHTEESAQAARKAEKAIQEFLETVYDHGIPLS